MTYEHYTVDDFLLDDSFLAYCRGNDPAAAVFWEQWQQQRPVNLSAFGEARQLYRLLSANKPQVNESLRELDALINAQSPSVRVTPLPVQPRAWPRWQLVASLLLISTIGFLSFWWWSNQYIVYETDYNQQRTITLPDGSTVTLNSHSVLKHRRNGFSNKDRTVELAGEGFFTVRHTLSNTPFRVVTGGAFEVAVLGTEFSVQYRPRLERVVLNSGRVQLRFHDSRPAVALQPGQLAELRPGNQQVVLRRVRPDQHTAWLRHQFVFDNASLAEVVETIENQFGVTVRIEGAAADEQSFTGILPISRPEAVLRAVAELNRLTLSQVGREFVLSR